MKTRKNELALTKADDEIVTRKILREELSGFATKDDQKKFSTKEDLIKFATKDDLKRFATKEDLKKFATKEDLKKFATKEDLKKFATKEDLKRFATKEDLKKFATKEDLKKYPTKEDLKKELEKYATKKDLDQKIDQLAAMINKGFNDVAKQFKAVNLRIDRLEERLRLVEIGLAKTEGRVDSLDLKFSDFRLENKRQHEKMMEILGGIEKKQGLEQKKRRKMKADFSLNQKETQGLKDELLAIKEKKREVSRSEYQELEKRIALLEQKVF